MHGEDDGANPEAVAMGEGNRRRDGAGSDRGAVQLDLIALYELVAVLEVGLDRVAAASAEDDEAHKYNGSDDCRYGGNPSNPAYRSHSCLVSPPEDTRRSPVIWWTSQAHRRRRNVPE